MLSKSEAPSTNSDIMFLLIRGEIANIALEKFQECSFAV